MLFIEYPKCSTCQKAKKWLDEKKRIFFLPEEQLADYGLSAPKGILLVGVPGCGKFFNTSGMLYKSMQLKERLSEMSEEEQLKLLATDGMLVKRPIIVSDKAILTGFREKEWTERLK